LGIKTLPKDRPSRSPIRRDFDPTINRFNVIRTKKKKGNTAASRTVHLSIHFPKSDEKSHIIIPGYLILLKTKKLSRDPKK